MGVQVNTREGTALVIFPVHWLLSDIQSKVTPLPLYMQKENRILPAHMLSRRKLLYRRVKLCSAQELCSLVKTITVRLFKMLDLCTS